MARLVVVMALASLGCLQAGITVRQNDVIVTSGSWSATICTKRTDEGHEPGSLRSLLHGKQGFLGSSARWCVLRAGAYGPERLTVTRAETGWTAFGAESSLVVLRSDRVVDSLGRTLPLAVELTYCLLGGVLRFDVAVQASDSCALPAGLSVSFRESSWDSLSFANHLGVRYRTGRVAPSRARADVFGYPRVSWRSATSAGSFETPNALHASWAPLYDPRNRTWALTWRLLTATSEYIYSGPPLHSVLHPAVRLERQLVITFGRVPADWQTLPEPAGFFTLFPSAADQIVMIMLDDVPIDKAGGTVRWVVPDSFADTIAWRSRWLIRLLADHPQMKMSWVVLPDYIHQPSWIADTSEHRWWWVQGRYHDILHQAPPEYKQWLVDIEQGRDVRGYEHQLRLGNHGLHHTPSLEQTEPYHEFMHYDPAEHDSIFSRIAAIYDSLGLTRRSMTFFRAPGFRNTQSMIRALIRHGFRIYDGYAYLGDSARLGHLALYITPEGHLWETMSLWSGDPPDSASLFYRVLNDGIYMLATGHCWEWFTKSIPPSPAERYAYIHALFEKVDRDYPHCRYLFPDEFADQLDALHAIRRVRTGTDVRPGRDSYVMTFDGPVQDGLSVAVRIPSGTRVEQPLLDGIPVSTWRAEPDRVMLALPAADSGTHQLVVRCDRSQLLAEPRIRVMPSPTRSEVWIGITARASWSDVAIFDVAGRRVRTIARTSTWPTGTYWDLTDNRGRPVASGVYLVRVEWSTGGAATCSVVVLR